MSGICAAAPGHLNGFAEGPRLSFSTLVICCGSLIFEGFAHCNTASKNSPKELSTGRNSNESLDQTQLSSCKEPVADFTEAFQRMGIVCLRIVFMRMEHMRMEMRS